MNSPVQVGKRLRRLGTLLAVVLVPAAGCGAHGSGTQAAESASGAATRDAQAAYLYVANQSSATISVIDMETDELVETIDLQELGFTANAKPHHVVVEDDGSHWYVSLISDGYVLKFDRENELVGRAAFETPGLMALDPNSDLLYVGRSMAAVNPPQRIGVIDHSTMEIDEIDVFVARPHALLVTPDGQYVYTASLASNDLVVHRPETGETEVLAVDGGAHAHPHTFVQYALSPDSRHLVVGGEMTGQLLVLDATQPMQVPVIATLDVPAAPWHPVFSPDGRYLYFGNNRADVVTFVDTSDWSIARIVEHERFAEPHGIALSPDGSKLYVGNRNATPATEDAQPENGFVAVIDTASGDVIKFIEVGRYASGMGAAG